MLDPGASEAWFHHFDKDQSYRIDYREFDKGLKELKFGGQKEDCVKLWQELDEDNSGEISFEEFAEPQEAGLDGVPDGLDGGAAAVGAMGAVWLPAAAALLVGSTWASCEEEFKAKQQEFTTYGAFPFKIARGEWIPQAIQEYFLMEPWCKSSNSSSTKDLSL
eukprot:g20702.t1